MNTYTGYGYLHPENHPVFETAVIIETKMMQVFVHEQEHMQTEYMRYLPRAATLGVSVQRQSRV